MIARRAAVVAALLVLAASDAPGMVQRTPDRCADLLRSFPLRPADRPATMEAVGDDACRFGRMRFTFGDLTGYEVTSTLIRGAPPAASGPPASIRVEARGITLFIREPDARMNWLIAQQQVPFDIVLDATFDPGARRAEFRELSMEGEAVGRVALSATIENLGPPPNAAAAMAAATRVQVATADLGLDSRYFILNYVLPSLVNLLPPNDPGGAVERAKEEVARAVRALVPRIAPDAADAVARFAADFPRPRHPFALSLRARNRPVAPADLPDAWPDRLAALLDAFEVTARYDGAFR